MDIVMPLIEDVRNRGGAALRDLAERFDHVRPPHLRVPAEALNEAVAALAPELRAALELSISHNPGRAHRSNSLKNALRRLCLAELSASGGFRSSESACMCRVAWRFILRR